MRASRLVDHLTISDRRHSRTLVFGNANTGRGKSAVDERSGHRATRDHPAATHRARRAERWKHLILSKERSDLIP
jgi:hypothetical protein